jgi:hypothetical protein
VSLDVTALYPSVPIQKAFSVIEESLRNDESLSERTDWSVENIMILLKICMETFFKTIDGTIYRQLDGTPIGKSVSGPIAGIYMNWFEKTFVFNDDRTCKPTLWKRMKDDVFLIWENGEKTFDDFVEDINAAEKRIQFTVEKEKDGILPFLNLKIMRVGERLETDIYRKPTHTQRYVNWRSNHPRNNQIGILKNLLTIARRLCDN